MLLGTRDGDIQQATLLFQFTHAICTHWRRKYVFFQSDDKHRWELQSLRRMNGHQRHLGLFLIALAVQVCQQGNLLQKVAQCRFLFAALFLPALHKVLHTSKKLLQVLLA